LSILGDRKTAICRELTKKFETIEREKLSKLIEYYLHNPPKGEFVVIIQGNGDFKAKS
jgi:16S rRNA (cytidine1402-2'-O)-methyltransferase